MNFIKFRTTGKIITPCIGCQFSTLGDAQYIRRRSVHWGGYFEYIVKCSVDQRNIIIHDGDITTTKGDVQYIGGISCVYQRDIIIHVGELNDKRL